MNFFLGITTITDFNYVRPHRQMFYFDSMINIDFVCEMEFGE